MRFRLSRCDWQLCFGNSNHDWWFLTIDPSVTSGNVNEHAVMVQEKLSDSRPVGFVSPLAHAEDSTAVGAQDALRKVRFTVASGLLK